jgi:hypothetical protein
VAVNARWVLVAGVAAGAACGVAMSWADYRHTPAQLFPAASAVAKVETGVPKLVVDNADHDFGYVEVGKPISHAFRLTNVGTATLTLKAGPTSCSACTIAELTKTRVPPGESAEVVVEYAMRDGKPKFQQTAYVLTNDPQRSRVELNIRGNATARYRFSPSSLVFSRVSANEPTSADLKVLCFVSEELRVFDPKFTGEYAEFFDARIDPLSPEEAAKEEAKSGYRVLVTLKPGLPVGPFRQTIRVKLQLGDGKESELSVPIQGSVVSDLTIVGRGWRGEAGVLTLGAVSASKGVSHPLTLLVRGEHRQQVEVEPLRSDPPWLKITAGKNTALNDALNQIPLTVEVPPDSPTGAFLGNDQSGYAEIILGVKNQPDVKEMKLHVKLVVGNTD